MTTSYILHRKEDLGDRPWSVFSVEQREMKHVNSTSLNVIPHWGDGFKRCVFAYITVV